MSEPVITASYGNPNRVPFSRYVLGIRVPEEVAQRVDENVALSAQALKSIRENVNAPLIVKNTSNKNFANPQLINKIFNATSPAEIGSILLDAFETHTVVEDNWTLIRFKDDDND